MFIITRHTRCFALAIALSIGIITTYVALEYKKTGRSFDYYLRYGEFFDLTDQNAEDYSYHDPHHNLSLNASELNRKVRVLCWVLTNPKTLYTKGKAVKDTWGKRCDKLLFMSSKEDKSFPAVGLDVPEGHDKLWFKTRAAWQYVFDHYLNDAQWFLKADDDTYVIVENLKYLCSKYNPEKPYFFGRRFRKYAGYNSGGAGYVFSKQTVRLFAQLLKDPRLCATQAPFEDVEVGKCLANLGVHPGDARDSRHRETFHPFPPEHHLIPGYVPKNNWLYDYNYYPVKDGPDCCADYAITFHYITPNMMYQMEYFTYRLRPAYRLLRKP